MTVLNRIENDAAYQSSYPDMRGSGQLAATHEAHIFLADLDPTKEEVERYYKAVKEWNDLHPNVTDKMKACYLALVFRDPDGKEKTISVMQSARYIRSNSTAFVVKETHDDADWFAKNGFTVIREKIEATAYGILGIPIQDEEMKLYPQKYFEFHIKVGRQDGDNKNELTEAEIAALKKISEAFTKKFKTPVPLSYNRNPHQLGTDGQGHQRFLNVRFREIGLENVKLRVKEIEKAIDETKSFKVLKTISEYVWYDSYTKLDHGWIDYTQDELARRVHARLLPQIVAFLGPKHVGKDTAADFLVRAHGFTKYSLADPVKRAVQQLFHFTNEQLWGNDKDIVDRYWGVKPREVMQFIGIDTLFHAFAKRFPQIGSSICIRSMQCWQQEHPGALIAISDLRMKEDLDALKKMGALIIRLERPGIVGSDTHSSEAGVSLVQGHDHVIVNDSTVDALEQKIETRVLAYEHR